MTKIADDSESIAKRLKELEAEKLAAIMGKPIEEPKPVEAPKDIDWTGLYGAGNGNAGYSGQLGALGNNQNALGGLNQANSLYNQLARQLMTMVADNRLLASMPEFIARADEKLNLTNK